MGAPIIAELNEVLASEEQDPEIPNFSIDSILYRNFKVMVFAMDRIFNQTSEDPAYEIKFCSAYLRNLHRFFEEDVNPYIIINSAHPRIWWIDPDPILKQYPWVQNVQHAIMMLLKILQCLRDGEPLMTSDGQELTPQDCLKWLDVIVEPTLGRRE
jgi:hypothetical protein